MSFQSYIEKKTKSNRKLVKQIKKIARFFGFNLEYWHRYASYKLIKNDINCSKCQKKSIKLHSLGARQIHFQLLKDMQLIQMQAKSDLKTKTELQFL